ncbi:hypothetical protein ACN47E_009466 [Coniothyrium glycines]
MPAVRDHYDAIAAQKSDPLALRDVAGLSRPLPRQPAGDLSVVALDAPQHQPIAKRQQQMVVQGIIPTYYNTSGPQPGTVVGIVLGSVAGFLLIVWLLYSLTNGGTRTRTTTAMAGEEEIVVRRRRNSQGGRSRGSRQVREVREISRSPRRSGGRSQIIVDERRPPTRTRSIIVEERHRVPGDDVVEVIEEHEDYRERRGSRRGPGYR